jgi:hypothetical protein
VYGGSGFSSRDLGTPSKFTGAEDQWAEWSFTFRAWAAANGIADARVLDRAGASSTPVLLDDLPPEKLDNVSRLYYALIMTTRGPPQLLLRGVEAENGIEGWRVLCNRYERRDSQSLTGLLQTVVRFDCGGDIAKVMDKIAEFEVLCSNYEAQSNEVLQDRLKMAVLARAVPDPLRSFLQVQSGQYQDYISLKRAVREWILAKTQWKMKNLFPAQSEDVPMDVDALRGRKPLRRIRRILSATIVERRATSPRTVGRQSQRL